MKGQCNSPKKQFFPPVSPEGLFYQDKRRREWDEKQRKIDAEVRRYYERFGHEHREKEMGL